MLARRRWPRIPFVSTLIGDASLSRRPMRRVMAPLDADGRPRSTPPTATARRSPSTAARCRHRLHRPKCRAPRSRAPCCWPACSERHDQRRRARRYARSHGAGAGRVRRAGRRRRADRHGRGRPAPGRPDRCACPGDFSSAGVLARRRGRAARLATSTIDDVGLNPTRTALLDVLRRSGADVEVDRRRTTGTASRSGRVRVGTATLARPRDRARRGARSSSTSCRPSRRSATFGGSVHVSGAAELRVKESDRIAALVAGLRAHGRRRRRAARRLPGPARRAACTGGTVDAHRDHRLAMAFAIAALGATRPDDDRRRRCGRRVVSRASSRTRGERLRRRAREGRQDLPGRLHGRRQVAPSRGRSASGSTGRSRTSTS